MNGVSSSIWLIAAVLIVAQPIAAQREQPSSPDFSSLRSLIDSQIAAGVPGIAVAIARHGTIVWEYAAGMGDTERKVPATTRTPFYLASVSKTITSTALMHLVAQNKLALDRPVNDYLGAAKVHSPAWDVRNATIRRVLSHTAGFATYDRECLVDDRACDPSPGAAIRRYAAVAWPPGEQFDYSNLGYGVLGEAIAHVSREPLSTALRQLVFEPLGMTSCSLGPDAATSEPRAIRYEISSPPRQPAATKVTTTPGASAVYCNVEDVARLGMFHLKDHLPSQRAIVTDAAIDDMQTPTPEPKAAQQYGMGWWLQSDLHGFRGVLAQGGTSNATARLQLIPSEDIAVAVVSNSAIDSPTLVDEALAAVLPQYKNNLTRTEAASSSPAPTPAAAAPRKPDSDMVGAWQGYIQTYLAKVPLIVVIDDTGRLVATLGSGSAVTITNARFGPGVVRWTMPGHLGVEGEPFDLAMRLYRRGRLLAGAAQTQPAANNPTGFPAYFAARLEAK
jgi:CubicO group peptidase (beta-lactamase class C family)